MKFVINKNIEEISNHISSIINRELSFGKKVFWFVSGGSVVPIEVLVSQKINKDLSKNLVISLVDERYGIFNHSDSNWFNLIKNGFEISNIKCIPYLSGLSFIETKKEVALSIEENLLKSDYKIGVFGIGEDGHTAGILPYSEAIHEEELICAYNTPLYQRITITPKTILMLDEAIVYAVGENKWDALEKLKKEITVEEEPAQILKKVPVLTIFTDYKVE